MIEIRTSAGQTVDQLCRQVYGRESAENLAAVYDLNPGLAALGPVIPLGTRVRMPDPPTRAATVATVSLWD